MLNFCSFIILFLSTITASFAQQCLDNSRNKSIPLFSLAQNSLSSACLIQREQYKCSDLEAELLGEEKKKVIQCDAKSIEENKLSNMSFGSCIFNGLKMSGEQLLDLGALPGKIAEGVAQGFRDAQLCNVSIEKKRELLTAFNLSVNDNRFKLSEQFLGRWLEEASCAEIDKLVYARYQNYQRVTYNERINDINAGKKVAALPGQKENSSDLIKLLKSAMSAANVRYECYTPKVKAEMICAGVTSLIVDAALGMGIKSAITKISAVVKSKKALNAINRSVANGDKTNLNDAAKLTDSDRKKAAGLLLNQNAAAGAAKRVLSSAEEKALINAHEVGKPRGYFTYTREDLAEKSRILKEAGFSNSERRLLMESGITGEITDPWTINAITTHYKKTLGKVEGLSAQQSAAIIKMESLGPSWGQNYLKGNPAQILKDAGFSQKEIDTIIAAKKAEESRLSKGLAYKEPVVAAAKPATSIPAKVTVPETTPVAAIMPPAVVNHAEKAVSLSLKQALEEAEKLRIPRDARGARLIKNGKEAVATSSELEASSEYLYRAAKIEREAAEEAYRKKNRTLKADVDFINKHIDSALEASLRGDGTVARKIVRDAINSKDNSMKNLNTLITNIYESKYEFPNGTDAQKAASAIRKANLKKVFDEIKEQKGDSLLTNGNSGVLRSMNGYVSAP